MGIIHCCICVCLAHMQISCSPPRHSPTHVTLWDILSLKTQTNTISPTRLPTHELTCFFWQSEVVREMERKWHRAYFHKSPLLAFSTLAQVLSAACLLSLTIRHSRSAKRIGMCLSLDRREDGERDRDEFLCGVVWEWDRSLTREFKRDSY